MDIMKEDVDRLFSYNTIQQVKILDRFLGILNNIFTIIILGYVVIYVFLIDKGHLEYEAAKGLVLTHVTGDVVSQGTLGDIRFFSANDFTYPGLENGNVMVATKIAFTKQERGVCMDMTMPCASADDCSDGVDAECTEEGICKEPSWCDDGRPDEYKLPTADVMIWVKSAIQFMRMKPEKIFSADFSKPIYEGSLEDGRNTFTTRNLLDACDPPVMYEELSELGAAIEVQFVYDCNVGKDKCTPRIQARRVENIFQPANIGFTFSYPQYTGVDKRTLVTVTGIRFYIRAVGTGEMLSTAAIILKLSTGLTLLGLAPIIVDLMMVRCFKGKSAIYFSRKYDMSEDFSEIFADLEAKKAEQGDEEVVEDDGEEAEIAEANWRRRMDEEDEH